MCPLSAAGLLAALIFGIVIGFGFAIGQAIAGLFIKK